jgi:uncharacterized delta-60 repeat protein
MQNRDAVSETRPQARSRVVIRFLALIATMLFFAASSGSAQTAGGKLDPTFSDDGKVTTDFFGARDQASAIASQRDGKIVVAGDAYKPDNSYLYMSLSRYNVDGSLDQTFGTGGKAITSFPSSRVQIASALVIQPDGKIVVVGHAVGQASGAPASDFALARFNSDGSLDEDFGTQGQVTTNFFGGCDAANAVLLQPDGKIVAAGYAFTDRDCSKNSKFALARYNSDGSLDEDFGRGGKVTTKFYGGQDFSHDIALQPDGKIVAGGFAGADPQTSDYSPFALARYNPNGSLDTTFDDDGKQTFAFRYEDTYITIRDLVIQQDGKIVAAGGFLNNAAHADFILVRVNSNGSLDTDFGDQGKVVSDLGKYEEAKVVALQPDDKILVAGGSAERPISFRESNDSQDQANFTLARYHKDGSLDTTFGRGGKSTTDFSNHFETVRGMLLQPDNKIVVAGTTTFPGGHGFEDFALARYSNDLQSCVLDSTFDLDGKKTSSFVGNGAADVALQTDGKIVVVGGVELARFNKDGSLDTSFGQRGRIPDLKIGANAVLVQPDGKIVAGGTGYKVYDESNGFKSPGFALVRYNSDGSPDSSFGTDGLVITIPKRPVRFYYYGYDIALQKNGKIVVVGISQSDATEGDLLLMRYNSNGSLDTTFGNAGIVRTVVTSGYEAIDAVAIQPDGKIVVGGETYTSNEGYFILARYNRDGSLDRTFGNEGIVRTSFAEETYASIHDLALQPDGKIIATGQAKYRGLHGFGLARYNSDGSLDDTFGDDGKVIDPFPGYDTSPNAVKLRPDGKIIVAGQGVPGPGGVPYAGNANFFVMRFGDNGSLDTTFGVNGRITADFFGRDDGVAAIALQPDDRIVAVGYAAYQKRGNRATNFAIARFSADGSSASHELVKLAFADHLIAGCQALPAVVTLCGPAPPGGLLVSLRSTNPAATVPATVTVPEGEISATFDISTTRVNTLTTGVIIAQLDGVDRRGTLDVRPVGVQAVRVPIAVNVLGTVTGTVELECQAPAGGIIVTLSSSDPAVASPKQSQIKIPAGSSSGSFEIEVTDVSSRRDVIISATANGIRQSAVMRVY